MIKRGKNENGRVASPESLSINNTVKSSFRVMEMLTIPLKCQAKIAADDTLIVFFFFYFYLLKEIRLDVSYESSARQRIHMKNQVLFSLKNNEKVFI